MWAARRQSVSTRGRGAITGGAGVDVPPALLTRSPRGENLNLAGSDKSENR